MTAGSKHLFRSRDAAEDLISIWLFGAEEWSPELADKHLRDIDTICDRFLDQPELGRKRGDLQPGIHSILVRPHVIFYKQSASGIYLVRVLHQRHDVDAAFLHLSS